MFIELPFLILLFATVVAIAGSAIVFHREDQQLITDLRITIRHTAQQRDEALADVCSMQDELTVLRATQAVHDLH